VSDAGVTPIDLATRAPLAMIPVPGTARSIAVAPDGSAAYVTTNSGGLVPIVSNSAQTPITVGTDSEGIAITANGTTAYIAQRTANRVVPVTLATRAVGPPIAVTGASSVAIVPGPAPVAQLTITSAPVGAASTFDASASTAAIGTIAKYQWDFGDGATQTTTQPTTTHVYGAVGTYNASVTLTDSLGVSSTRAFTGRMVARNGGPSAVATTQAEVAGPAGFRAYVVNEGDNTVTPVDLATNTTGTPIPVGDQPTAIAITPDGKKAYVTNSNASSVTPIDLTTNTPGAPIPVGSVPWNIAITPDGSTAWVANQGSYSVTPIATATNTPGPAIPIPGPVLAGADAVTIAPDGSTLFVAGYNTVTPVNLATRELGAPMSTAYAHPKAGAITPDGERIVTVDDLPTILARVNPPDQYSFVGSINPPIFTSYLVNRVAISPTGTTGYISVSSAAGGIYPFDPTTGSAGAPIPTPGNTGFGVAFTPDGATALVTNLFDNSVSLVNTATNTVSATIAVGTLPWAVAVVPDQSPVARLNVDRAPLGQPSTLDASASTVSSGTRASYAWDFGDGTTATTSGPVVQHTYATANLTASVTVTNSIGTSTSQVFTGQTMSRNGSSRATATAVGPLAANTPVVNVVKPAAGPTSGGTEVTLSGANFTGVTDVAFGGVSAPFTVKGATTIKTTAPTGASGVVDIVVTGPAGSSARSAADRFTYIGSTPTVSCSTPQCTTVIVPPTSLAVYATVNGDCSNCTVTGSTTYGTLAGSCASLTPVVYTVDSSTAGAFTTLTAAAQGFGSAGGSVCAQSVAPGLGAAASLGGTTLAAAAVPSPRLRACSRKSPVPPCVQSNGDTVQVLLPADATYQLQFGPRPPAFKSFAPTTAAAGDQVTISGARLDRVTAVTIAGLEAPIISRSTTSMVILVPDGATTGRISLVTSTGVRNKAKPLTVVTP
jgi:YVTN family beta-propeller protein